MFRSLFDHLQMRRVLGLAGLSIAPGGTNPNWSRPISLELPGFPAVRATGAGCPGIEFCYNIIAPRLPTQCMSTTYTPQLPTSRQMCVWCA